MKDEDRRRRRFLWFDSTDERRPVEKWYKNLHKIDRMEIKATLAWLSRAVGLWREPEFKELDGGISEIRPTDIRRLDAGKPTRITYRIYGAFGVGECKGAYILLHGTEKRERNDRIGKGIARERLRKLERNQATVSEFDFEGFPGPGNEGRS
jgi:hypothetical protein